MNVDQLVTEAASLPREQRRVLIERLLAIGRGERDLEFRRLLAEKVDDTSPGRWATMEDAAKYLRADDDAR